MKGWRRRSCHRGIPCSLLNPLLSPPQTHTHCSLRASQRSRWVCVAYGSGWRSIHREQRAAARALLSSEDCQRPRMSPSFHPLRLRVYSVPLLIRVTPSRIGRRREGRGASGNVCMCACVHLFFLHRLRLFSALTVQFMRCDSARHAHVARVNHAPTTRTRSGLTVAYMYTCSIPSVDAAIADWSRRCRRRSPSTLRQ